MQFLTHRTESGTRCISEWLGDSSPPREVHGPLHSVGFTAARIISVQLLGDKLFPDPPRTARSRPAMAPEWSITFVFATTKLGIVFVFPPPHGQTDSYDWSNINNIVLSFVVPAPKYGWSDRPATGLAIKEAMAEFRECCRNICGETEVEEEVEEDDEDGAEAEED